MRAKFYVDDEDEFGMEPSEDNIAQAMASGVGDGTIMVDTDSDLDYAEESDYGKTSLPLCNA